MFPESACEPLGREANFVTVSISQSCLHLRPKYRPPSPLLKMFKMGESKQMGEMETCNVEVAHLSEKRSFHFYAFPIGSQTYRPVGGWILSYIGKLNIFPLINTLSSL